MLNAHQCIIDWLIRLPLLRVADLASLMDIPEREMAWMILELEKFGWVEGVRPSSPELDDDLLYVISPAAETTLVERNSGLGLENVLPVARTDVTRRLSSIEITVGVHQFFRTLDYAVWRHGQLKLEDVRLLPLSAPPELRWWPPGVEAYGCIRQGGSYAPFFLAWDRPAVPRFHRQRRVAGWYDFWDSAQPWGRDNIPSILVPCPGEIEHDQWADAVMASADRRQMPDLPVLLAFLDDIFEPGPLDSVWCRPSICKPLPFFDRVNWWRKLPVEAEAPDVRFPEVEALPKPEASLRAWANRIVLAGQSGSSVMISDRDQLSALSLLTSKLQKEALELLGRHPLLSAGDLAVVLGLPSGDAASKLLTSLQRYGLTEQVQGASSSRTYHYLTSLGLKLIAAREGVPHRRIALHGNVIAKLEGAQRLGRFRPMLRQLEHSVGTNGFFVRLIADAKPHGEVFRWLNEPEARKRVGVADRSYLIRPDGAAELRFSGLESTHTLSVEWDRGSMRGKDTRTKCWAYALYYSTISRSTSAPPAVLFVTNSLTREKTIRKTFELELEQAGAPPAPIFTSQISLVEHFGPWERIWAGPNSWQRMTLRQALCG